MAQNPVAARYAGTLFDAAKTADAVEPVFKQLHTLSDTIKNQPNLGSLLGDPGLSAEQKADVLLTALDGNMHKVLRAGLNMMLGLGRAEIVSDLAEAFQSLMDEDRGNLAVTVRSVRPLSDGALKKLKSILEKREQKTVTLKTEVDESLIGGVQVQLDYRVIDASVKRQLALLHQQLLTVRVG